jgi:phage-related minor tail protein
MSSDLQLDPERGLQNFGRPDAAIAKMAEEYLPLVIAGVEDTVGFKRVHEARMVVKNRRVEVEKVRKSLKADALEYGRKVDAEANRIKAMLQPIESHLDAQEDAYNAEKERIRNAERLRIEEERRKAAEAEAARIKAIQEAEAERLRIERENLEAERALNEMKQKAAQAKLDAQRAAMEAERRAAQDKVDAERRAIEAEQKRLADIEAARLRAEELERAKVEAAERAKRETEERLAREAVEAKAQAEAAEAAEIRRNALRPDREKLAAVSAAIKAIEIPSVSVDANDAATEIRLVLMTAAEKVAVIASYVGT